MTPQAPMRVAIINLGCVRNTVDSHSIMASLERQGHILSTLGKADAVVVNTCAFVDDAKKESVDVILDLVGLKKQGRIRKIIVAGCLAQRYGAELAGELKEVDAFVGVQTLSRERSQAVPYLTPPHYAYVKICESCFNACSFCVIPKIKGRFVSRSMEAVLADVRSLNRRGVKEVNIIGQDVTAYGLDIYRRKALPELLREITQVTTAPWVRLLYTHPAHITDELLDVMASSPRVCRYLDMPLQHVSDRILKLMNRRMTQASTVALVRKVRRRWPGVFLRTTFIVGFPGETAEDFDQLLRFIEENPFERVGVFKYSREEGTAAYDLPGRVPAALMQRRYDRLMQLQQGIAGVLHERLAGREVEVIVEERIKNGARRYVGRSEFDAPDVDGVVHITAKRPLRIGEFARVRVSGAMAYDLHGEAL